MTLPGPKLKEFHEALLSAFTRPKLARVVRFTFDKRLDAIVKLGSEEDTFFELIEWAESEGKLSELISAAHRDTPDNPKLSEFYAEWIQLNPQAAPTTSEETLRKIAAELEEANTPPIIDRVECVDLFLNLLDPDHAHRFLRVTGNAKMGKSHLLTKIFPQIAKHKNIQPVVIDLREQSTIDILQTIGSLLDPTGFTTFDAAYTEWLNRPRSETDDLSALLAQRDEKAKAILVQWTRAFVGDLKEIVNGPTLLIFDQVEGATHDVQHWLCNQLLVQVQPLPEIRVVIGGRELPPTSGSYQSICCEHPLTQVEEAYAYVDYCRQIQANIADEFIPQLAKALFYSPGAFAESMTQFTVGGHARG